MQERGCLVHCAPANTLLKDKKVHETITLLLVINFAKYSPIKKILTDSAINLS